MKKIISIVLLVSVLCSCNKHEKQLKEVEELILIAEKANSEFSTIDSEPIKKGKEEVLHTITKFARHLNPEWVTQEQAIHDLSDYRALKKPLSKMLGIYLELKEELPRRLQQLKDLKEAIKIDQFETLEEMDGYIKDEREKLEIAVKNLNTLIEKSDVVLKKKERYDHLIDSLHNLINESLKLE